MTSKSAIIVRSVGVIAATTALATGVTWAALSSNPVTLNDTTLNTGTASLKIWDGNGFATSAPGFQITGLVPGTPSSDQRFFLQNDGGIDLDVTAKITAPPSSVNIGSWDGATVTFTEEESGDPITYTVSQLLAGPVALPGDGVDAGASGDSNSNSADGNYKVSFNIEKANVSGSSASISDLDLQFDGTQK